jgi:hypothetical protein
LITRSFNEPFTKEPLRCWKKIGSAFVVYGDGQKVRKISLI